MTIELKIADKKDAEEWDKLVDSSQHGTIFHTWKWLKIAEKHTNSKLYPIVGYKGAEPVGVYPVFHKKKFLIKMVFSPPSGTAIPYLGPVIANYASFKQSKRASTYKDFNRAVDEFVFSKLKPHYTSISLTPSLDPRPFLWTDYKIDVIFDYHLDLTKGEEKIWQDFDINLRGHIKKAIKGGIKVENGTKEDIEDIYYSLVRRYREQNKIVTVPKEYLLDLYDAFYPNNLKVFMAKYEGKNVGGIVAIVYKDKVSFWIGAAKPEIKKLSPNDLAQWEAIKWACDKGLKIYEEIGAGTERLAEFKAKYNPELSIRFSAVKSSFVSSLLEKCYKKVKHMGFIRI